jgi:hypothetical protein
LLIYITTGIPRVICILDDNMYGMAVLIGLTTTSSLKEMQYIAHAIISPILVDHIYYLKT